MDDNKGLPYMDFPNFFDALFELADMWTSSCSPDDYVDLLRVSWQLVVGGWVA